MPGRNRAAASVRLRERRQPDQSPADQPLRDVDGTFGVGGEPVRAVEDAGSQVGHAHQVSQVVHAVRPALPPLGARRAEVADDGVSAVESGKAAVQLGYEEQISRGGEP